MTDDDPSRRQTREAIATYYREVEIGAAACIRETDGGMLRFVNCKIIDRGSRTVSLNRLPSNGGGPAFYFDGRNWKYPGGQSRLVIPAAEIDQWMRADPIRRRLWRVDAPPDDKGPAGA